MEAISEFSANKYVGRRISCEIDGDKICQGTIDGFCFVEGNSVDTVYCLWHVAYDDGDEGEIDHANLLFAMDLFQGKSDRSHVGRRVSRKFGSKICDGTVDKFDSRRRLWKIAYDYGGTEEMDHRELLYAIDLFGGKGDDVDGAMDEAVDEGEHVEEDEAVDEAESIESPKPKAKTSRRNRRKKNDVQLFAFEHAEPTAKRERGAGRPRRKLKAVRRFDPLTYDPQTHCRIGHGFACPRCSSICSYDSRECDECYLECFYEPGVGPVVLKERRVDPLYRRCAKHVGRSESPLKMMGASPIAHISPPKSVEDVTDFFLAMAREQRQIMLKNAVEIE